MKYKFKIGDSVNYTNGNGLYIGERKIIGLSERSGEATYFIYPTDSPWYSINENQLKRL